MTEQFSEEHPFSRPQVAEAARTVASEAPGRALLIRVTTGYRALALRQFVANQVAYVLAVPTVFGTAWWEGVIHRRVLWLWLSLAVGGWVLRLVAYYRVFSAPPAQIAHSLSLRLIPLGMISMSTLFWMWSVSVFVGPSFTATAAVLMTGLLALSVAMIGLWPTTPVAASSQLLLVWATTATTLVVHSLAPWPIVAAALAMIAVTLWAVVYVSVMQIAPLLERSDRVDLLVAELQDANARLETLKNELWNQLSKRSTFFAGASHDFRQRIHAFKLLASTALKANDSPSSASRQTLQHLVQQVESLEEYFSEILDFARIEAIDASPHLAEAEVQRIFQQLDLHFYPLADERGIELTLRPTRLRMVTDAAMLQRILQNLISNALKVSRQRVVVAARRRETGVVLEVWDQGPGLREEDQALIFDAFYQGENARGGAGLGLAIVQRFADSLGYALAVKSRPGRGAVFRVHIPSEHVVTTGRCK